MSATASALQDEMEGTLEARYGGPMPVLRRGEGRAAGIDGNITVPDNTIMFISGAYHRARRLIGFRATPGRPTGLRATTSRRTMAARPSRRCC